MIPQLLHFTLLAIGAFWLGACPFSLWIGRWVLHRDIRAYGDGNPGAANVFRAGGRLSGCLALVMDVGKGIPFVILAHSWFELTDVAIMVVALSAILGHAFSPLLGFKGGKAIAVTFGVLSALPQLEMLIVFAILIFLGFLFLKINAWTVLLGPAGSIAYLVSTRGSLWELTFMICVLTIFAIKHLEELKTVPRFGFKPIHWFQSRKREI